MTTEFIALDLPTGRPRLTHLHSMQTLLRQPYMGDHDWREALARFLGQYPTLDIHYCPRRYSGSDETRMASVADVLGELKANVHGNITLDNGAVEIHLA